MEVRMLERRQVDRTSTLKSAKIILFFEIPALVECTVINLTNEGACVEVADSCNIAESFELTFDSARSFRKCRLIWKSEDKVGVSFK
jgi:hypothetical protein